MVQGSRNVEIFPKEDEGYCVRSMLGNKQYAVISGKSIYNLHEYETVDNRYLLAHTGDTVQELNETLKTWTVLKSGLTTSATTASMVDLVIDDITTSTRRHYMFFTNGVDAPFIYEKGNVPAALCECPPIMKSTFSVFWAIISSLGFCSDPFSIPQWDRTITKSQCSWFFKYAAYLFTILYGCRNSIFAIVTGLTRPLSLTESPMAPIFFPALCKIA